VAEFTPQDLTTVFGVSSDSVDMEEDVPKFWGELKDENSNHICIHHASLAGNSLRGGTSLIMGMFFGRVVGMREFYQAFQTANIKSFLWWGIYPCCCLCSSTIRNRQ
jgi:hypothetical protein